MIAFNEQDHIYENRISVSEFLSQFKKPFKRDLIASKTAKSRGVDKKELLAEWDLNGKLSRAFGNTVDMAVEYWVRFGKVPKHPFMKRVVEQFQEAFPDRENLYSQIAVYNDDVAGTTDVIKIVSSEDKIIDIIDEKTYSDKYKNKGKYLPPLEDMRRTPMQDGKLQLSTYKYLAEHMGWTVRKIIIANYTDDFEIIEVEPIDVEPLFDYKPNKTPAI